MGLQFLLLPVLGRGEDRGHPLLQVPLLTPGASTSIFVEVMHKSLIPHYSFIRSFILFISSFVYPFINIFLFNRIQHGAGRCIIGSTTGVQRSVLGEGRAGQRRLLMWFEALGFRVNGKDRIL